MSKRFKCTDIPKGCRCVQHKWVFNIKVMVFREDLACYSQISGHK